MSGKFKAKIFQWGGVFLWWNLQNMILLKLLGPFQASKIHFDVFFFFLQYLIFFRRQFHEIRPSLKLQRREWHLGDKTKRCHKVGGLAGKRQVMCFLARAPYLAYAKPHKKPPSKEISRGHRPSYWHQTTHPHLTRCGIKRPSYVAKHVLLRHLQD